MTLALILRNIDHCNLTHFFYAVMYVRPYVLRKGTLRKQPPGAIGNTRIGFPDPLALQNTLIKSISREKPNKTRFQNAGENNPRARFPDLPWTLFNNLLRFDRLSIHNIQTIRPRFGEYRGRNTNLS